MNDGHARAERRARPGVGLRQLPGPGSETRWPSEVRWLMILCWAFLASSLSGQNIPVIRPKAGPAYRGDRLLLVPRRGAEKELKELHRQQGTRVLHSFPAIGGLQVIELPPGAEPREVARRFRGSGHVQTAELDHWIEAAALPDDPGVTTGSQWHLNNTGLLGGTIGADIHALEAWNVLNNASNIVVAVIDSGCRQTHEDLAANLWVNPAEIPGDGQDNDGNGIIDDIHGINGVTSTGNPEDDAGHGTHVSGIIGAVGNNGRGGSGVAWKVQVMPCKFLTPSGGSESSLIQCLDYARDKGARIINCSFVAPASAISSSLSNAFWSVRNAGIIVVAAAGNFGSSGGGGGVNIDLDPQFPASFPMDNIVVVTGTTRRDEFSGYNFGTNTVHLGAPGTEIYSTYFGFDSNYGTLSGTSMAAPCVSGALALMRARFPGLNYRQLISRLLQTVEPLPSLAGRCSTGGRLNLARALGMGSFTWQFAGFDWVPTNGMTPLVLSADGVSLAQALPFGFSYFGETQNQVYVGANGLLGFTNVALGISANSDLPSAALPNAVLCPLWDDLNPELGGSIWFGQLGAAPNRRVIITWADVPHAITAGEQTRFTFQALLHETGEITFQYLDVETGRSSLVGGKSATVGLEDGTGLAGLRCTFNGSPFLVTNQMALLFTQESWPVLPASLSLTAPPSPGLTTLLMSAQPGRSCVLSGSDDFVNWTPLVTNLIPASGVSVWGESWPSARPQRFYRTELAP